jgi:Tol biopolymer transport system component
MELWFLHPEGAPDPKPYLTTAAYASQGRFSPNDRFVAYTSNQSGRPEVYVRPFPESARAEWTVSKGGGTMPRWRGDGKELFYVSADSTMMAVDVGTTTPDLQVGLTKALFRAPIFGGVFTAGTTTNVTRYDVTADGTKFLINAVAGRTDAGATPITVVLNWPELLKPK